MPIIYSLVSRTTQVLAEYTSQGLTGNFSTVTRVLLKVAQDRSRVAKPDLGLLLLVTTQKIPEQDGKLSYLYDKFVPRRAVSSLVLLLSVAAPAPLIAAA